MRMENYTVKYWFIWKIEAKPYIWPGKIVQVFILCDAIYSLIKSFIWKRHFFLKSAGGRGMLNTSDYQNGYNNKVFHEKQNVSF